MWTERALTPSSSTPPEPVSTDSIGVSIAEASTSPEPVSITRFPPRVSCTLTPPDPVSMLTGPSARATRTLPEPVSIARPPLVPDVTTAPLPVSRTSLESTLLTRMSPTASRTMTSEPFGTSSLRSACASTPPPQPEPETLTLRPDGHTFELLPPNVPSSRTRVVLLEPRPYCG